jgi:hypothetical protein
MNKIGPNLVPAAHGVLLSTLSVNSM